MIKLLAFALLALEGFTTALICSSGFVDGTDNGCYKATSKNGTFFEVFKECRDQGAYMASIHSQEANAIAHGLTRESETWLGLNSTLNAYSWTDGSKMDYNNFVKNAPRRLGRGYIRHNGTWNIDANINTTRVGVCRMTNDQDCEFYTPIKGDGANTTVCYTLHEKYSGIWSQDTVCKNECATLAVIKSAKVNSILLSRIMEAPARPKLIGLKRVGTNLYQWSDGSYLTSLDYNNFGVIDPNFGDCFMMVGTATATALPGQWVSAGCYTNNDFFCTRSTGNCLNKPKNSTLTAS